MDFEIYGLLSSSLKLCTLHDLQTKYNTEDLYDLLEVIDVNRELQEIAEIQAKQQEIRNG